MQSCWLFGEEARYIELPCRSISRARGVVVSHPLSMREALGSIPSVSMRAIIYASIQLQGSRSGHSKKPCLPLATPCGLTLECLLLGAALQATWPSTPGLSTSSVCPEATKALCVRCCS